MCDTSRLEQALSNVSYTMSMAVLTMSQIAGMQAENQRRIQNGEALAYTEKDFEDVAINNGMHHNAVCERDFLG